MKTITTALAASATALALAAGPAAEAAPAAGAAPTTPVPTQAAAKWKVTGKWVGPREGYGTITLHIWRKDGRLVGTERSSKGCTWRLKFVKKRNGAFVFQEKMATGRCGSFRIRLSRQGKARLKVTGGWMFDEVLHRP